MLEAYGMTEASHQMASNPRPPKSHKGGSVGPATGIQIGIMTDGNCSRRVSGARSSSRDLTLLTVMKTIRKQTPRPMLTAGSGRATKVTWTSKATFS